MATEEVVFKISLGAENAAKQLARIKRATNELRLERKVLDVQLKTNQITQEEYNELLAENIKQSQKLSTERQKETRNLKNAQAVSDDYNGSLVQQRGILRALQTQFDNLSEAERENEDIGGALTQQIDELNEKILNSEKSTGRAQREVGFYEKALTDAAGGINIFGVNLGSAATKLDTFRKGLIAQNAATGASSKGLQLFKVALISTGIGAIVVVIGTLVAAFLSTQEGIDKATRAFRPFQVAFERVIGLVQDFAIGLKDGEIGLKDIGQAIVDNIVNRVKAALNILKAFGSVLEAVKNRDIDGIKEGLKDANNSFLDFGTGIENTRQKLIDFKNEVDETSDRLQDISEAIEKIQIRNATLIADLRAQAEAQRTIAQNVNLTTQEREAAAKKAIELIDRVAAAEQELIDLRIEELETRQALNDTTRAEQLELANLQAQRNEIERNRISQQREVSNQLNSLIKENTKAEADALEQLRKLRESNTLSQITNEQEKQRRLLKIQKQGEQQRIELLNASEQVKNELLLALEEQYQIQLQQVRQKYADQENAAGLQKIEREIKREQDRLTALRELDVLEAQNLQERNDALLALELQRQANELANFTGTEEQRLLLLAQFNQREIELTNQLRDAKIASNNAQLKSATNLFSSLAGLFKENAALQKAAALFQLGVNTAATISEAIRGATQAARATGPAAVVTTPTFIATQIATVLGAVGQATAILKRTKFEKGGVAQGKSHAQGGIPFIAGGQLMEMEGGELIVNKGIWNRPDFVSAISEMNYATGGVRFGNIPKFQDGGTVNAARGGAPSLKDLPPVVVTVEDINAAQRDRANVVSRAIL